jgi:hypothetical protein
MIAHFAAALPEVTNQLFATIKLGARRLVAIKIADQTNSERDIVEIIAMNVAAIDLTPPTIAHFDLAVPGGSSVADHEMVGESVLHSTKMSMVVIEGGSVSLPSTAVVDDDELPTAPRDRSPIDLRADRARQVAITRAAAAVASSATK